MERVEINVQLFRKILAILMSDINTFKVPIMPAQLHQLLLGDVGSPKFLKVKAQFSLNFVPNFKISVLTGKKLYKI